MKQKKSWHSLDIDEIFSELDSSLEGVTEDQARNRLKKYGPNILPGEKHFSAWYLFFSQFANPLMYIMITATLVAFYLNKDIEAIFVGIVLISNALVGFYQERKANLSLQALKNLVKQNARVIRDKVQKEIDANELVPGDILVLRAGDKILADGRILEEDNLRINEASLTGESKTIEKTVGIVSASAEIGDRTNMVFMGTIVEGGSAKVLVTETGIRTQYGDIISLLKNTPEEPTPLQNSIVHLSKFIGIFITFLIAIIILEGYLKGQNFELVFETALALFISAIPEGLLPAITIILVLGMNRILKQKGLIRRLAATETLGSITVICTDKTGTLTEGQMTVQSFLTTEGTFAVGNNFQEANPLVQTVIKSAALATDAYIENPGGHSDQLIIRGSSTEQALVKMAYSYGIQKSDYDQKEKVLDTLFFSSDRKYSASLRQVQDETFLYTIGALEKIDPYLKAVASLNNINSPQYLELIEKKDNLIAEGYRVIACAYRKIPQYQNQNIEQLINEGLILAGFIVISDPIRSDVLEAFEQTRKAGIKTIIITGDHRLTAQAVAHEIGLEINDSQIMEGHQLETLSNEHLQLRVKDILLFARVSPRHKLRIVEALQKNGERVAMFGDGINDAPALKIANIGVAVGTKVPATQEVADLILLDGGFSTIIKAIEEGRLIFLNIRRIFLYLITQDLSQFFIFMISIILGLPLPLIATQLLLINLVESGLPDLALTTEQEKEGVMNEPPRQIGESVMNGPAKILMASIFVISGLFAFIFYFVCLKVLDNLVHTRTMLMVFMALESLFLVFSLRSFSKRIFRKDIFSNRLLTYAVLVSLVMILIGVYFKPLQRVLETYPLRATNWLIIVTLNLIEISLIDGLKIFLFRKIKFKPLKSHATI